MIIKEKNLASLELNVGGLQHSMVRTLQDLRPHFHDVRDQGQRPTCLAFALSDAHCHVRGLGEHLSPEYLYFYGVQRTLARDPARGLTVCAAVEALRNDGQTLEVEWPYSPLQPSMWKSPSPAPKEIYRADVEHSPEAFASVCDLLKAGRAAVLILKLSETFYSPDSNGIVRNVPSPEVGMGHAVVVVGIGELNGEGYLLIRNSWGDAWGDHGHAWLSEGYLSNRILSVNTLKGRV